MEISPYLVVNEFEKRVSEWAGAKYGVAVDSCSAAIFLSIQWVLAINFNMRPKEIIIPSRTYPSVPCSIIHSGMKVKFVDIEWAGEYQLSPLNIWDAALRFKKGMYHGGLQCLSFHIKKRLPIGRGGMILTDDEGAYNWLKKARFDGRNPVPLLEDDFDMLGWNCYMEPSQAAYGIQLFETMRDKELPDLDMRQQGYPNLSMYPIYQQ